MYVRVLRLAKKIIDQFNYRADGRFLAHGQCKWSAVELRNTIKAKKRNINSIRAHVVCVRMQPATHWLTYTSHAYMASSHKQKQQRQKNTKS